MNKLLGIFGALVALFSSMSAAIEPTQYHQVGIVTGLVFPTSRPNCFPDRLAPKNPSLPKNIPHATYYNTAFPPYRFRGDARVRVTFETPERVNADAGVNGRPFCGSTVFAFSDDHTMTLPNACQYPATDQYAVRVCNLIGRRNNIRVTIYFQSNTISTQKNDLTVPNPCIYRESDAYARLACHELGHVNGWPIYHGD